MVTVSIIPFNSLQFCPESSFAAFQSISRVKDSSRLECVPRDFLLSVFCAKWKWEMKNITTFPKNGHTSKNTGSIMVTLDRYSNIHTLRTRTAYLAVACIFGVLTGSGKGTN